MGGCAGTQAAAGGADRCDKALVEQPVPLSVVALDQVGKGKGTKSTSTDERPICLGVAVAQEESSDPKTEVCIGIPESIKAQDAALTTAEISFCAPEEAKGKEEVEVKLPSKEPAPELARTLLQDLGKAQGKAPMLPILGRAKSEQEISAPPVPRARSMPVMLPAAAVRSRSMPRLDFDGSAPSPVNAAQLLPAPKSPTTALAPSRRRKRRSVTFGEAECKEFVVEAEAWASEGSA